MPFWRGWRISPPPPNWGRAGIGALLALALQAVPALAEGFLRLEGHGGPIKGVAVSPDGTTALTASFDYSVGIWDLESGALRQWAEGHDAAVNAVAFLPDGRHVLSAGDDFTMILWDLSTGAPIRRFAGHKGKLLAIAVSPDGRRAATAGWDGDIGLWDIETGERLAWLDGHKGNVNDVEFSGDGRSLYSASYDGTIRRWDLDEGGASLTLVRHGFGVNHLVLNEAAGWLAYGALDGAVRAIDLATEQEIADLTADRRPILALALDPQGRRLAVGDGQGYIMVIDTESWTIERDFHAAAEGPIWALAWDGKGNRLLAGGLADEAALWPLEGDAGEIFADGKRHFQKPASEMTNGERQFVRKCSVCHTLAPDGARRAGPSLYGVFGRRAGSLENYSYSDALQNSDIVWGDETIDRLFTEGPEEVTPGSKMPMQQIAKPEDRLDLIAYLKDQGGAPQREAKKTEGETE